MFPRRERSISIMPMKPPVYLTRLSELGNGVGAGLKLV
jgi:hypothetical protein